MVEDNGIAAPELGHVHVRVDHREKVSGVPEHLAALPNVTVAFDNLEVGDYWVGDQLIFERKTMRDFAESIIDTRLFTQATQLMQRRERVVFMLEGGLSDWGEITMRRESLQGAIISLTLIFGTSLPDTVFMS